MTSHKLFVLLLLSFGLLSAFNLSEYYYADEGNVSVGYTNFTQDGKAFSIVELNGEETFLLENGEPVTQQERLDAVLHAYYKQQYYPSQHELDELRALLKQFNDSRNNGYDFKNKEEYSCRDDVLMSNGKITVSGQKVICKDNASCTKNALLLFSVYAEGLNLGSPDVILKPLMEFTPYSLAMDEILANSTSQLDNLTEQNIIPTLQYIKTTAPILKNYSLKIESTIFRTPRLNDSADRKACQLKCWAICPSFDLDQAVLDQLAAKADALSTKISPFAGYLDISTKIRTNTDARMEHRRIEGFASQYQAAFAPMNASGAAAIALAEDTLKHVLNNSLRTRLDRLKSLHVTIPEDVEDRNFTNVQADMAQYGNLTAEVRNMSNSLMEVYNSTRSAKNSANSLIFVLETKDLDPVSMKSLSLIKNDTADIDATFREGLSVSDLMVLQQKYGNVTARAKGLLTGGNDMPATKVMLLFRGLARKVNTGLAKAADEANVIPRSEIPKGVMPLGTFSALVFLSFASLAFLSFLYIFSTFNFTIPKAAHIFAAAFICLLVLLFGFSAFMYLLLGKTSNDATLPEFIADLNSRNSTSIVVDMSGASLSDAAAMQTCAAGLANTLSLKNKSWSMYSITANGCTRKDSTGSNATFTPAECLESTDAADSAFSLAYSASNEPPKFTIIYQNRAEIRANLNYYESCPLTAIFS